VEKHIVAIPNPRGGFEVFKDVSYPEAITPTWQLVGYALDEAHVRSFYPHAKFKETLAFFYGNEPR